MTKVGGSMVLTANGDFQRSIRGCVAHHGDHLRLVVQAHVVWESPAGVFPPAGAGASSGQTTVA